MSKYTIELRYLLENNPKSLDLALSHYPIYNEEHRQELNEKIINHFAFYEIGFETEERFLFELDKKMCEIMPYYNQLYKSEDTDFNPLFNIDITEKYNSHVSDKSKNNQNGKSNQSETGNDLNVNSDTPVQEISESDILKNKFASSTSHGKTNNSSNIQSSTTGNTENEHVESWERTEKGSSAGLSFSHAIGQWREIMINIDMQIISELENLFICIY